MMHYPIGHGNVATALTAKDNIITLTAEELLNPETTYRVTMTDGIKNAKGAVRQDDRSSPRLPVVRG